MRDVTIPLPHHPATALFRYHLSGMPPFFNRDLFAIGDRILVALSGGVDSLSLLHALAAARDDLGIELGAVHVHHGMRGADADADVRFLEGVCDASKVPLWVEPRDVPALARERRISLEEAGREARYAAFDRIARAHGYGKVATAHHAEDQAETVLLNLFRGAGIDGLAGIPSRRPLSPAPGAPELVRPLLQTRRSEIEAYCRERGLEPRDDATNHDLRYRRNRLRLEVLPRLEEFEPGLRERLIRLSCLARDETAVLEALAGDLLNRSAGSPAVRGAGSVPWAPPSTERLSGLRLERRVLTDAPVALARRALRLALRRLAGYEIDIDAALLERLLALCRESGPRALDLPGGPWRARRRGGELVFEACGAVDPLPDPVPLAVPGATDAPSFGLRIEVARCPLPPDPRLPPDQAVMDAAAVSEALTLRAPRTGDRFVPLGGPGSRLLSDLFIDRKIPRARRRAWPVITDARGIVWVIGLALADRVRVRPETSRCLHLAARKGVGR